MAQASSCKRRPRVRVGAVLLWLTAASGCPQDDGTSGPAPEPQAEETTPELRARAQEEALQRLIPLATQALHLDDPLTAAGRGITPPSTPPISAARRERLRAALAPARSEAQGLMARLLPPQRRVLALAARFGIDRAHDRLRRRSPSRIDPSWVTVEVGAVLDTLQREAMLTGGCEFCAVALTALTTEIDAATLELAGAAAPSLAAAAGDGRALAQRVRAFEIAGPGRDAVAAALERWADHLQAVDAARPEAPAAGYADPLPPASDPATVRTLPSRLGNAELRRRLEVEENFATSPTEAFTALGATIARLNAMIDKRAATPPTGPVPGPAPVDVDRCERAWAPIGARAAEQESLRPGQFSCPHFVAGLGGRALDDVALTLELVDTALVHTHRRTRQRAEPELLAALGGRLARGAQRHTMRTAILLTLPDEAAAIAALGQERDAACLAATALWIHGEVGTDDALSERLQTHCPHRPADAWIRDAEARPRGALEGMGLARIASGPAGVVTLDRYWWLPLGFIDLVADPRRTEPPASPGLEMKVEPVAPSADPDQEATP